MSSSISRRSLAKGAAWAAPVVVASAAVPAYAASSNDPLQPVIDACATAVPQAVITGLKSWIALVGTDRADNGSLGTFFSVNSGQWAFQPPAGLGITGYKMDEGKTDGIVYIEDANGKKVTGRVTAGTPFSAQVVGAGLQRVVSIQSKIPYKGLAKKGENYAAKMSIPFKLTWLRGLDQVEVECPDVYYINWDFSTEPDWFGNYPDSAGVADNGYAYSITTTPLYA